MPLAAQLKRLSLAAFALSLAANIALSDGILDWRMLPAGLFGWFLADAGSGIVHMFMDYRSCRAGIGLADLFFYAGSRESGEYLSLRRAVMGRITLFERLVFDFKTHHPRPDALGRRPFVDLVWSSIALAALPVSAGLNIVALFMTPPLWLMLGMVVALVGGGLAQYFHASLHRADEPAAIRVLRALGLLMTPTAHARHHASLRRDFATNSGWSNALLNPVFALLHRRGVLLDSSLEPR